MHKLKILNSKEKKKLITKINDYFASSFNTDKTFLQDEKGNLFLIDKTLANIDFHKLKLEKAGLFFGNKDMMLSIEGSQLLGKVDKNFIDLDDEEEKEYLRGNFIETEVKDGIYLLKNKEDFLGTAKVRNGKVLNALPKNRRVKA